MSQFQEQTALEYYVRRGVWVIGIGAFFLFVIVWFSLNRNFHKIRFSKKQQALIHAVIRILTPGPNWLPKRSTACVNWLGSILAF